MTQTVLTSSQLVQEHNAESFGSTSSNPTAYEAP